MAFREIAFIVRHGQGHDIEVIFVSNAPGHLVGSENVATVLAEDAGLEPVPAPEGICRLPTGASVAQVPKPGRTVRHRCLSQSETDPPNSHTVTWASEWRRWSEVP